MNSFYFFVLYLLFCKEIHDVVAIKDGQDAEEGQFKYMVKIEMGPCGHCGGAIINARYVLTAAHCVDCWNSHELVIGVGVADVTDKTVQNRQVEQIIIHDEYEERLGIATFKRWALRKLQCRTGVVIEHFTPKNDIALLKLETEFDFEDTRIQKIPLPSYDYEYNNEECVFAGWGFLKDKSDISLKLQWAKQTIVDAESCKRVNMSTTVNEFCAINTNKPKPAWLRKGDSGGPLKCGDVVYGVLGSVSNVGPVARFMKVTKYLDFIVKESSRL